MADAIETPKTERRVLAPENVEMRVVRAADGTPTQLEGYGAVFNKESVDFGNWVEVIAPGAFTNSLKTSDVRGLVNHDSNLLLGRTPKTLHLTEDDKGLRFTIDLPNTQTGRDTAESIDRGDITGCSFSFTTREDSWRQEEDGREIRTLVEIDTLYDVGPVTFPAYPDTEVATRSLEKAREQREEDEIRPESGQNTSEPDTTQADKNRRALAAAKARSKELAKLSVDEHVRRKLAEK